MRRTRRCSYCFKPKHDRRTCVQLADDRSVAYAAARTFRLDMGRKLAHSGIVPGALVKVPPRYRLRDDINNVAVVVRINWDGASPYHPVFGGVVLAPSSSLGDRRQYRVVNWGHLPSDIPVPNFFHRARVHEENSKIKVLSQVRGACDQGATGTTDAVDMTRLYLALNIEPAYNRPENKQRKCQPIEHLKDYLVMK